MRTQKQAAALKHLSNSRQIFLELLDVSRSLDDQAMQALIGERGYEGLEMLVISNLLGRAGKAAR